REVLDWGGFKDFAHDSKATISSDRWAVSGVAGRFSDPLYSPGSDLIAIYNTLIVHAIRSPEEELEARCAMAERQMQAVFGAYIPSYAESYQTLGDPECFSLKYTWELAVYFAYYVFPFLNDLLTDRRFALAHLRLFSELGPINHGIQKVLAGYHQWKRENPGLGDPPPEPVFFDFTSLRPLAETATTFYEVGVSVERARTVLTQQLEHLKELARFVAAHVASVVLDRPEAVYDRGFVEALPLARLRFEPEAWEELWRQHGGEAAGSKGETYPWALDPSVVQVFHDHRSESAEPPPAPSEPERQELVGAGGVG
ncbi:MAG: hypothetical protein SX243_15645, partial [Acidobacteriota bacterium]|nr:hypothetical protein [Acidobacteriota bacterium]